MIKLFASDLDGTLLNEKHEFDDIIIDAIQAIQKHGKYFVIATGRSMFEGQRKEFDCIKGYYYTICMNGALIYNAEEKIIYKKTVDKEIVKDILMKFPEIEFECCLYDRVLMRCSEEKHYQDFLKTNLWQSGNGETLYKHFSMNNVYDVSDEEMVKSEVLKMNCKVRDEKVRKRLFEYLELHKETISNAPFEDSYFEITDISVNKAFAIKKIAELLNVKNDEVAVYGDGCNDLEMLSYFEHSYATENAHKRAKECAKRVIGHCKDHAVSYHIQDTLKAEK